MYWRINSLVFEGRMKEAEDIICSLGDSFLTIDNSTFPTRLKKVSDMPIVSFTTIRDAQINSDLGIPNLYYDNKKYNVSSWLPNVDCALNKNIIILPFGMIDNIRNVFNYQYNDVFIRPDSGNKTFTGCVVPYGDIVRMNVSKFLIEYNNFVIDDSVLCVISVGKSLPEHEFRFWIVDEKIATYSSYSHNIESEYIEPPLNMIEWMSEYVKTIDMPDIAYVLDAVVINDEFKIVEVNALSTSGVYNCNLYDLFSSVREVACREFSGEVFL